MLDLETISTTYALTEIYYRPKKKDRSSGLKNLEKNKGYQFSGVIRNKILKGSNARTNKPRVKK